MNQIKIIHEPSDNEPFIIVYKPHNLPTAPLTDTDTNNLLYECIKLYPEIKNVSGIKTIEYGLVHRLDTITDGLVLIATSQNFYNHIISLQKEDKFIKEYKAVCCIKNPDETFSKIDYLQNNNTISITSYFRYFGEGRKEVRPIPLNANKKILNKVGKLQEYKTEIKILKTDKSKIEVLCQITKGFKHQVRAHLACIGYPIINDPLYENKNCTEDILFSAVGLYFTDEKNKEYKYSL